MSKNGKLIVENGKHERQPGCMKTMMTKEKEDLFTLSFFRAVFAEFVGTFVLCTWTIGLGYVPEGGEPPSLIASAFATGMLVGCMITVLLNVSGGHINPAISIGFLVTGQITLVRFLFYIVAQSMASVMAVLLVRSLIPEEANGYYGLILPGSGITTGQAVVAEILIGFSLLFGTIAMVDTERKDVQGPVPLFVGLIVVVNIIFAANISGGCMNPARNFGPAVISGNTELLWMYWLGPLTGGALGALLYDKILSDKTRCGVVCKKRLGHEKSRDKEEEPMESEVMLQEVQ